MTINCDSNIRNNMNSFIKDVFPSVIDTKNCGCGIIVRENAVIEIDYNLLAKNGVEQLHSCILERFITDENYSCSTCNANKTVSHTFGDLIFFDVQSIELNDERLGISQPIVLENVEKIITLKNRDYELTSVIELYCTLLSRK